MSKQTSLVSVVIPTYNRARWLPLSIGSVQRQTLTDWELLVVDDRSTDETKAVVTGLAGEDPRIRYLCNARGKGVSGARNTGIDAARGEFVAFLDSDDEWFPQHLQNVIDVVVRLPHEVDVACALAERRIRSTGELFHAGLSRTCHDSVEISPAPLPLDGREIVNAFVRGEIPIEVQTAIIRRTALTSTRFPEDLRVGEDGFFFAVLAESGARFALWPEPHVILWAHDENTTSAGGRQLPADKLIQMYEDLERLGQKTLETFSIPESERHAIRKRMAGGRFWQIGYRGHLLEKRYADARRDFRAAMRWDRWNFSFWRTYLLSYVRQCLQV